MKVQFSTDKKNVLFTHETETEYKHLQKFPGLLPKPGALGYYAPAKSHIIYNLIERLKASNKTLKVSSDVFDFANSPFKLKSIPQMFRFHTKPMDYQEIALRYIYSVGSGGLLLDPGMGKSKVVLDFIWLMQFKKSLVVCPKALLFVWEDEIAIHRPELKYYVVKSTDWEAEKPGMIGADVVIINYNKAVTFTFELQHFGFNFIHLDEFLIKSPKSDRTDSMTKLSHFIEYRCGGSGTLINNTPMDMYSPIRYLEESLVGPSYRNFEQRYGVFVKPRQVPGQPFKHPFLVNFRDIDEAKSILDSCCIVMTKEEWLKNLPKKVFHKIYVDLSKEQEEAYDSLSRNYICTLDDKHIEVDNSLVMMAKLYQISNGFIYSQDPNEVTDMLGLPGKVKKAKRETYVFPDQPKIKALNELIKNTIGSKRCILWFNMEAEFNLIKEYLDSEGLTYSVIRGGEKKTGNKVRGFNNDESIQFLVCQAKSVNYGITVLGKKSDEAVDMEELDPEDFLVKFDLKVHTQIFYSLNFSLEVFLQQQDRIHRLGQTEECNYYLLFAFSPVEKAIEVAMDTKMNLRKMMLVDIAESLRGSVIHQ